MSRGSGQGPDFERLSDLLAEAGVPEVAAAARPATEETGRVRGRSGDEVPPRPRPAGRRTAAKRRSAAEGRAPLTPAEEAGLRVAAEWRAAVGDDIADNSQPRQLKAGRLVASASSPAWAQTLQFMSEDIRRRLNERLGEELVATIFFRHAGWEARAGQDAASEHVAASRRGAATGGEGQGCDAGSGAGTTPPAAGGAAESPAGASAPRAAHRLAAAAEPAGDPPAASGGPAGGQPAGPGGPAPGPMLDGLTAEQREAIDQLATLDLADELRERLRRTMLAAFVREGQS